MTQPDPTPDRLPMPPVACCAEPGCTSTPDRLCGEPTGAGCGEPFCDDHLYDTDHDGYLCAADYQELAS